MTGRWPDERVERAVSLQRWDSVAFLHWAVPAAAVQPHLPPGLAVDTWDGQGWLGVTPFVMRRMRAPFVPPAPHLSTFSEVNLRTYVRAADGTTGLWFFTLRCPRLPVVLALRALGVPYVWARVETVADATTLTCRSRPLRRSPFASANVPLVPPGVLLARVTVGDAVEPDDFLTFLTGRWCAYTWRLGRLWRIPVEHPPWPLHAAEATADVGDILRASGLPDVQDPPLAHFSPGVDVRFGAPRTT